MRENEIKKPLLKFIHATKPIQSQIHEKKIDLVWSYILEYENKFNPYTEKRNAILQWKQKAITHILENKAILNTAEKFILMNIRPKDALHIACAIVGKCDYFLTTDDAILAKKNRIKNIHILNPLDYIQIIL